MIIITIYRSDKEPGQVKVERINDVVKYSIVANKLHYLPLGESWQEIDLTTYDIRAINIRK